MTRTELFNAIRPFAPNGKFTDSHVKAIDALADSFGLSAVEGAEGAPDPELIAALKRDEGLRLNAYRDTVGVLTIGYGHTGPDVKPGLVWNQGKAEAALIEDVREHNKVIHAALPWLKDLDPVRRRVIENMHFNMGWDNPKTPKFEGLSGFKNTLEAVRTGRYNQAASGMLNSKWSRQVGKRAVRLAQEMLTGRA